MPIKGENGGYNYKAFFNGEWHDLTLSDSPNELTEWLQSSEEWTRVRHGRWSINPYNREWDVCSACGIGTKRREYGINPDGNEYMTEYSYRYCPNCGAKMEVEDVQEPD